MSGYVATIGFFDGVHLGHRHIINDVLRISHSTGLQPMVITFDRHPRTVLRKDYIPQLLNTTDEKLMLLKEAGIERTEVLRFDTSITSMTAREFMSEILRKRLDVRTLVVGYDNRFGHNREEGFDDYKAYGKELGIDVVRSNEMTDDGLHVSSSAIRRLIAEGDIVKANKCLGYEYTIRGKVVRGTQTGHSIGFPTANILPESVGKLIPANGAYAVLIMTDGGEKYEGMTNIGLRPTFKGEKLSIETNIFGFEREIYDETITIKFIERIREERKYESVESLRYQLHKDKITALDIIDKKGI